VTDVVRLIGVYNAEGTVRGELSYWFNARRGRAHCALCDITHGSVRRRPEWTDCVSSLPVPFETFHRDDQPDAVRAAIGSGTPAVVAETAEGVVALLGPAELDECHGSVDALMSRLRQRLDEVGLTISNAT
jgi:hypothetical protein